MELICIVEHIFLKIDIARIIKGRNILVSALSCGSF